MANVLLRRTFTRNIFKFNQISACGPLHPCANLFLPKFDERRSGLSKSSLTESSKCLCQPKLIAIRSYSDEKNTLSLFQKFKLMYKEYWYVLVPVHIVTSAAWFGGFYYLAKSGVDIVGILESWNISEKITNPLKDSSMGYIAVAYGLYKIATPARYTVTLGGTTISINYLKKWGYIKPVPSREKLKQIYEEKKGTIIESMREKREELKVKSDLLKDKKGEIVENLEDSLKKLKNISHKIKPEPCLENIKKKGTKS